MRTKSILLAILCLALCGLPWIRTTQAAPTISNINMAVTCNTSALINFRTSVPSRAFLEYGPTTSYGLTTIDDSVRFYTEHAIQITGLAPGITYHFRINATNGGTTQSLDQTFATTSGNVSCPELSPQVDSRMPDMAGAVEYLVKSNCTGVSNCFTNFQTALNTAGTDNGKRFITVDAGLVLTNQFQMPVNADQNWIIIRSSAHANLAEGKRVFPADASSMFKIQNNTVDPVLIFAAGSNHIRIIGAEVTIDPAALADAPLGAAQSGLIYFVQNIAGSATNLPRFIGVDRCYVHGLPTKNTRRGIYAVGEDLFFIDSYISEFHHAGEDAQAILFADIKRAKILNNTLISAGENFMWGGTGLAVPGYQVSGLEYLRNHMYWPLSWKTNGPVYGGFNWVKKNLFELKTSAKTLLFGNYFGGTTDSQGGQWPDAQQYSINIKLEQNSAGPTTCDLMEDFIFYKNFGKNLSAGVNSVGRTNSAQGCPNNPQRVLWRDNLLELDAATWSEETGAEAGTVNGNGWTLSGTHHQQVIHNTVINANPAQTTTCNSIFSDGSLLLIGDPPAVKWNGFIFKDNITDYRACGVAGGGFLFNAIASLDGVYTGWVFTNNGIMRAAGSPTNFPPNNVIASSWASQLVTFNGGLDGNYRVAPGSSWDNAASDGTDIGADIEGVLAATSNTPTGLWSQGSSVTVCRWNTTPACQQQ